MPKGMTGGEKMTTPQSNSSPDKGSQRCCRATANIQQSVKSQFSEQNTPVEIHRGVNERITLPSFS